MLTETVATVKKSILLTPTRAARLRQLAQRYHVREEQVITRALDVFFNLTEELDPQGGKFHEVVTDTTVSPTETVPVAPEWAERAARFDQALTAYQTTGESVWVNVLVDSVLGCLGQAQLGEYDPALKWGGYYEGR
jgi:hypothetical protein